MSIDHVCFDVEIMKTIEETPGGWDSTHVLGVAVAALWQYRDQRMRVYGPEDVPELQERLLKADRISGFNVLRFDYPVTWAVAKADWKPGHPVYDQLLPKTDDMLRRIWQALGLNPDVFTSAHKGWGLNAVAEQTLNARKIGYGGDGPKWFQAGQIQKVCNYCLDDVALERDLTDFVERYGFVVKDGVLRIPPWKGA
jgi:DEAD/DEAH box helicase domain-containing protein